MKQIAAADWRQTSLWYHFNYRCCSGTVTRNTTSEFYLSCFSILAIWCSDYFSIGCKSFAHLRHSDNSTEFKSNQEKSHIIILLIEEVKLGPEPTVHQFISSSIISLLLGWQLALLFHYSQFDWLIDWFNKKYIKLNYENIFQGKNI